jgi:hypothetical protein
MHMQEKRGNREQVRLQKSLEFGREINEQLIPTIVGQFGANLTQLTLSSTYFVSCLVRVN